MVSTSTGLVTALSPALGHEIACDLALEAHRTGRPALELVRERQLLTDERIGSLTTPQALTGGSPR